jgi:hypothetical protein
MWIIFYTFVFKLIIKPNYTAMKNSERNLSVLQNFILHITHSSDNEDNTPITFTPSELYQMANDYIEEDHVDGKENPEDEIIKVKFWVESSFDHEDKDKEYPETLIVGQDMGDEHGTQTIGSFGLSIKEDIENLIEHFNEPFIE